MFHYSLGDDQDEVEVEAEVVELLCFFSGMSVSHFCVCA